MQTSILSPSQRQVGAIPDRTHPLEHHALLHGQGGCLSTVSSACAAHSGEAVDAEDRAQAPHVADTSETLRPHDAVLFPFVCDARPRHWVIYEPG